MKKIILLLISLLFTTNVYAIEDRECTSDEIINGTRAISNVTFDLIYNPEVVTMEGKNRTGFFDIRFPNLPDGYVIEISNNNSGGALQILNATETVSLRGGVYKLEYYNWNCNTVLKSYDIFVPSYKIGCDTVDGCEEKKDLWADKTDKELIKEEKKATNYLVIILIAILIILILITSIFLIVFIKRRRSHEKTI